MAVFVSPDDAGTPRPVDKWTPETPGDMALAQLVRNQIEAGRPTH